MIKKTTIVAINKFHLKKLIFDEIDSNNEKCDLNHIDISKFNGDISKWDTRNVTNMSYMFCKSEFNGELSNWPISNILNIIDIKGMFFSCSANRPWWYIENNEKRTEAINKYQLMVNLESKLNRTNIQKNI